MSVRRVVACNIKGCMKKAMEEGEGTGWPGWGSMAGKQDAETGETTFYLCPPHLEAVFNFVVNLEVV